MVRFAVYGWISSKELSKFKRDCIALEHSLVNNIMVVRFYLLE